MGFNPMDIVKKILELFLKPLLGPLYSIIEGSLKLVEFLVILISKVPVLIQIAIQIFNPVNILNDSITGIFMGIKILFKGIIDALNPRNIFGKGKIKSVENTDGNQRITVLFDENREKILLTKFAKFKIIT